MGLSEDNEDVDIEKQYEEICMDLNMDRNAKEDAWESYCRIKTNYVLEGEQIHWLACALYESCRKSVVPTVGRGTVEGNCVSLTRLLRSAKFSLLQFFSKMKKWSDMANLPQEFRDKVERLERNFAVSTVIFKKFEPIFFDLFRNPNDEPPRPPRSRKQRRLPCSVTDVFKFCWTMYVQVKGNFPAISDDLVNSYHLLLCCLDWFYANTLLGHRKDLINPEFSGLPEDYHHKDWKAPDDPPCIMDLLCKKHEGLDLEAKTIKEHWWKPHIKWLFEKKMLKGKADTLSGVLETGNFEANMKTVNNAYEEYVLSVGDFDERIFLGEDVEEEIGISRTNLSGELSERMQQHMDQTTSLTPLTPLTGRRYLKEKDLSFTPVSTATQSVSRLQTLLSGRKTSPSERLVEIFEKECTGHPQDDIVSRVKEMGEVFCNRYIQPSENFPGAHIDFAKKRLQLAESLYYMVLESIVESELKKLEKQNVDLTMLLTQDVFHRSLFACCLEIVIFSYNSIQRTFPWIVEIFDLSPYFFYKVVELLIRAEEGLSRDVVKHLNHIEECILESLAWKSESPLWEVIEQLGDIPTCEDVTYPYQMDADIVHPSVKRLQTESRNPPKKETSPQSPTAPSAMERFDSPQNAKRRLFVQATTAPQPTTTTTTACSSNIKSVLKEQLSRGLDPNVVKGIDPPKTGNTFITVFKQAPTDDNNQANLTVNQMVGQVYVPVQHALIAQPQPAVLPQSFIQQALTQTALQQNVAAVPGTQSLLVHKSTQQPAVKSTSPVKKAALKPKKTGSSALFFRKMYHLASVRLRDLCDRLGIDNDDLRKKMWTCFEYTIVQHIELMKDRHMDQFLMCAVYVISKITENAQTFQNIMKGYRLQPQAQSHVYRSVLLYSRRRRVSGSSNSTSGSSSPVQLEKEELKKKKTEVIRSSSTLPIPHPNSQPPTPTRFGAVSVSPDLEERGDLIQFYNKVYVKKLKNFVLKFSQNSNGEMPPLSPLPLVSTHPLSPRRRVSNNSSVYISPHKSNAANMTPTSRMLYCFNKSPAKNLLAINNMIKWGEKKFSGKRILPVDETEEEVNATKRVCPGGLMRKLQDLQSDRVEANGGLSNS